MNKLNTKFIKQPFYRVLTTCVFFIMLINGQSQAAQNPPKNQQIMAGFILHFTSFVDWPGNDRADVSIDVCILAEQKFTNFIKKMVKTRPTNRSGKEIKINDLKKNHKTKHCNIVYSSKEQANSSILKSIPDKASILLVTELNDFPANGMINFHEVNKRIRLEINLENAKNAGLRISSELLKLAKIVQSPNTENDK